MARSLNCLHLIPSLTASKPHLCGSYATGSVSFLTILKIILNPRSLRTVVFRSLSQVLKGEKEAKAIGGKWRGALQVGSREPRVSYTLPLLKMRQCRHFCSRSPTCFVFTTSYPLFCSVWFTEMCRSYGQAGPHARKVIAKVQFPP